MKILSLMLGSIAACAFTSPGFSADLGINIVLDDNNFDGFLLGASFGTMAVAMTPSLGIGEDQGGHMSGSDKVDSDLDHGADGSGLADSADGNVNQGMTNDLGAGAHDEPDQQLDPGGTGGQRQLDPDPADASTTAQG